MMDMPTPEDGQYALFRQQAEELASEWRQGAAEASAHADRLTLCQARHERLARGLGDICDHTAYDPRWQSSGAALVLSGLSDAADGADTAAKSTVLVLSAVEALCDRYANSAHALETASDEELQDVIDQEQRLVESVKNDTSSAIANARKSLDVNVVAGSKSWSQWDGVVHAFGRPPQA